MADIGLVRQVSGEWNRAASVVRLRIDAEKLDQPQDVLIAPRDLPPLIGLLLELGGKTGAASPVGPGDEGRTIKPLRIDSLALGETEDGDTVIEINVGQVALAFYLPSAACRELGQTLLALGAPRTHMTN